MNLIVETVKTGPFQENTFIGWNSNSDGAFLVDPGDDAHLIIDVIERNSITPKAIINTHAHLDHIGAVQHLKEKYKIVLWDILAWDFQKNISASRVQKNILKKFT